MSITRLSQKGIGEQAYPFDGNVRCSVAYWGWQSHPVEISYETHATTRLAQIAIGVPNYPRAGVSEPINVTTSTGNFGWQGFPVTIPEENFSPATKYWGWIPQAPILCSQVDFGYAYSFNGRVWPSCTFNDFVFGERGAVDLDLRKSDWGWQSFNVTVEVQDPITITPIRQDWGWFGVPVAVSHGSFVQAGIGTMGWSAYPVTVSMPQEIVADIADWGWRGNPVGVSFSNDIGCTTALYGWQAFPVDVVTPSWDIIARWGNWGWQSFPATVRQTTLVQDDIEAIADAVWQRMLSEGAVQQWVEVWQRMGMDPDHGQMNRHPKNGGAIEVAGITVEQTEDENGDVWQHRQ